MACFCIPMYFVGVFWGCTLRQHGENSQSDDDEPKGNSALEIHLDLLVMAYLQANEVPVGVTPKEQNRVVHKVKQL